MNKLKIAVIGAGSSYTPEFVDGIIKRAGELPVRELWLVDIEEGRKKLDIITALTKRMIEKSGIECSVYSTTDLEPALKDADFVTTQIRVGFLKAREYDERIPLSHGILGQETNGAGGFFKALRTIPVLLQISEKMSRLCPDAWLINFTNPEGIVTEAVHKYGAHKKIAGVCNVPISLQNQLTKKMGLDSSKVTAKFLGLNHNVFLTDFIYDGKSVLPDAIEAFLNNEDATVANVEAIVWERDYIESLNAIPCPYHRYYYKYDDTLRASIEKFNKNETRAEQVALVEQRLFELYQNPELSEKPEELSKRGGAFYSDVACNLMSSIHNDKKDVQTLGVLNKGVIPFLDDDCVIECSCYVGKDGFVPVEGLKLPESAKGLIFDMKNFEKMTIEAAVTGDRKKAIEALTANRLVSNDVKAKIIFEELLEVHKRYLPQFNQK